MRLRRLQLQNFRQFSDATIEFASGGERNVTVVHGDNGSGKTTLLNAFTWLFYNEVDFDSRPDRLANEGAMADADVRDTVEVIVQLEFEHENAEYTATRTAVYEKRSADDFDGQQVDADIELTYEEDGSRTERQNPSNVLDQIIPERLSELFFFDGEDIDELAGIDNQDQIQEAIQNLMGLTILERATRHLDTVAGRFEEEVAEYGSEELSSLIDEKQALEEKIADLEQKQKDKQQARARVEDEIFDVEKKLEEFEESDQLHSQREERLEEIAALEDDIEEINDEIKDKITEKGFVPLAMPLIRETAQDIDDLRERGEIPSELTNDYLNTLLENKECICGRPLKHGTEPYERVASMKGEVETDGVEQGALRIIGQLQQFEEMESSFFDEVDELIARRKEKYEEIDRLEELVDEIGSELQDLDETIKEGKSVAEWEAQREQKEAKKRELTKEIGRIENQIQLKKEERESLEERISEQRDERQEALLAMRRQAAAEAVAEELNQSFANLKDQVRARSNQVIKETFNKIASKNLTAEITQDFELKIWQDMGDDRIEVDKSTGERQIASLAFIGSLVQIARERYEMDTDTEYFTGGIYPLVMDSPFGALDKSHRRKVSEVIPELASQVVVFATDSQWEGPVEAEMADRIGQQYWLDFDPGEEPGEYPKTRVQSERARATGD